MGYHTQPCRGPSERGAEPSLPSEESSTREGEGPRDHRVVGFAGVLVEPRIGRVAPYAAYVLVKKKKKVCLSRIAGLGEVMETFFFVLKDKLRRS